MEHFSIPAVADAEALARLAPLGEWVQDCEPPSGCSVDGLDPAWCLAEPSPFDVTFLDGEAVAITVDEDVVATLGLASGEWWTAWSDGVSCDRVVARFSVGVP